MPSDPLDALRTPDPHSFADPAFVARLRAELIELGAAIDNSTGASMAQSPPDELTPGDAARVARVNPLLAAQEVYMDTHNSRRPSRRTTITIAATLAAAAATIAAIVLATNDDHGNRVINTPPTTTETLTTATIESTRTTVTTQPVSTTATTESPITTTTRDGSASTQPSTSIAVDSGKPPIQSLSSVGIESFDTRPQPGQIETDGKTVWVLHDDGAIDRYDAATGRTIGSVPITISGYAQRPVFAFGSLWITTSGDNKLWRVDATTGAVVASIEIPGALLPSFTTQNLAVGDGVLWVLTRNPADLDAMPLGAVPQDPMFFSIDPTTNSIVGSLPAPAHAEGVAYGNGSLWTIPFGGHITRVSAKATKELTQIQINAAFEPAFGFGALWVEDVRETETIVRIDPTKGTEAASISLQPTLRPTVWRSNISFGGGYVWTSSPTALLVQIDPKTNEIVARYGTGARGGAVAATDTDVWFTDFNDAKVHHLHIG